MDGPLGVWLSDCTVPMIIAREGRIVSCPSPLSKAYTDLFLVPSWTCVGLVPQYFSIENLGGLFINSCELCIFLAFSNGNIHREIII